MVSAAVVAVVVVAAAVVAVVVVPAWASSQTNVEPIGENYSEDSFVVVEVFVLEFGLVGGPSSSLLLPENLM